MQAAALISACALVLGLCAPGAAATGAAAAPLSRPAVPPGPPAAPDPGLAALGRRLFFDPSLSASGKLACASCHDPRYAYGPPPHKALALGGPHMNRPATRAVPSLRYLERVPPFSVKVTLGDGGVGPAGGLTWDGRAASLREQAMIPLFGPNEMANAGPRQVVAKLRRAAYAAQFRLEFGARVFSRPDEAFADALLALEAFERTPAEFFPYSSKYDAYLRGEAQLTAQEKRGLEVFDSPARGNCANCHLSRSADGSPPLFTDFEFDNIGAPRNPRIPANADPNYYDMGLCGPQRTDLTARKSYCGLFRTPTLRNVAVRDAFFHNGVFGSLRQVVQFYQQRDVLPWQWYPRNADGTIDKVDDLPVALRRNLDIDPPFEGREGGQIGAISDADIDDLIAFMRTLTDGYQPPGPQRAAQPPAKAPPAAGAG
ncbi:MAG TPA: cytochrome c peroxidase [Steroidobacteraceae bacterium]|nr:cytochrome c peroxidase [Steroidobacteraceae bacterium]